MRGFVFANLCTNSQLQSVNTSQDEHWDRFNGSMAPYASEIASEVESNATKCSQLTEDTSLLINTSAFGSYGALAICRQLWWHYVNAAGDFFK